MRKGTKLYGNFLEEYKVIEKIANGGNSEVYKVECLEGKIYALKLLNKNLSNEKIKRFKNEMFFCIKNEHDNIIKILDNGITVDKQIFYIMPYYEKTLRNSIEEEKSEKNKIQMFINILEGVRFFHKKGIIHRDIKPENILISSNNVPVISDFGIAHFCEENMVTQIETKFGSKMANFQYASPEQRERNGIITLKSDIYALGLIFNEMFTKKIPFGNSYMKVSHIDEQFAFLDNIIDKMISQNPKHRYDSVDEIISEIKVQIEINNREKELNKLKEIKFNEIEENDILILEPPKLVDFKYDENINKLFLFLDKSVNQQWINCMTSGSYSEIVGYGPEKFRFENNVAMLNLHPNSLNNLQQIINYFKTWVNNANVYYPKEISKQRKCEKLRKEQQLKDKIKREETIKSTLKNIHI